MITLNDFHVSWGTTYSSTYKYGLRIIIFLFFTLTNSFLRAAEEADSSSPPLFLTPEIVEEAFKGRLALLRKRLVEGGLAEGTGEATAPVSCFISRVCAEPDFSLSYRIASYLEAAGVQAIIDTRDLGIGDSISQFVERIGEVNFCIVLITPAYRENYQRRTWIFDEAERIRVRFAENRNFFIPLVLGEAKKVFPKGYFFNHIDGLYCPITSNSKDCFDCMFRILREKFFLQHLGRGAPFESYMAGVIKGFERVWASYLEGVAFSSSAAREPVVHYGFPDRLKFFVNSHAEGSHESYLTRLHLELLNSRREEDLGKVVIAGMGGIGKTHLASRYVHKASDCRVYDFIGWIHCETDEDIRSDYWSLVREIGQGEAVPDGGIIPFVRDIIPRRYRNWLLIFDNAISPIALEGKVPQRGGDILITSRDERVWGGTRVISLEGFQPDESVEHLFEVVNQPGVTERPKTAANIESARHIAVELLGCSPLALSQAACFMHEKDLSFEDYKKKFELNHRKALMYRSLHTNSAPCVTTAWLISVKKLLPEARRILECLCYLSPDRVPIKLLIKFAKTKKNLQAALDNLRAYAFIRIKGLGEDQEIFMHRFLQEVGRLIQEPSRIRGDPGEIEPAAHKALEKTFEALRLSWAWFIRAIERGRDAETAKAPYLHKTLSLLLLQMDVLEKHGARLKLSMFGDSTLSNRLAFRRRVEILKLKALRTSLSLGKAENVNLALVVQQELGLNPAQYAHLERSMAGYVDATDTWEELFVVYHACHALNPQEIETVIPAAAVLVASTMSGPQKADLLWGVSSLERTSRIQVCQGAKKLMQETRVDNPLLAIQVVAAYSLPSNNPHRVMQTLGPFVEKKAIKGDSQYRRLAVGLKPFFASSKTRTSMFGEAVELMTDPISAEDVVCVLGAMASLPFYQRARALERARDLTKKGMNGRGIGAIIEVAATFQPARWAWVQERIKPYLQDGMDGEDAALMMKSMARVSEAQWGGLSSTLNCFPAIKSPEELAIFFEIYNAIPSEKKGLIISEIFRLTTFSKGIEQWRIEVEIARLIAKVIPQKNLEAIAHNLDIWPKECREALSQILDALKVMSFKDLADMMLRAAPFIKSSATGATIFPSGRERVREAVVVLKFVAQAKGRRPPIDLASLYRKAKPFLDSVQDGLGEILEAIAETPDDQWDAVRERIAPLTYDKKDGKMVAKVLKLGYRRPDLLERAKSRTDYREGSTIPNIAEILEDFEEKGGE
jgi:hypothetical protein